MKMPILCVYVLIGFASHEMAQRTELGKALWTAIFPGHRILYAVPIWYNHRFGDPIEPETLLISLLIVTGIVAFMYIAGHR